MFSSWGLPLFVASGLDAWGSLFRIDSGFNLDTLGLVKVRYAFWLVILATLVVGMPLIVVIILTQAAVGGLNFAAQAMNFKGNRIDPIAGLKRIFSVKGLVELAKSVLKVGLLFGIGALVIYHQLPQLVFPVIQFAQPGCQSRRAGLPVPCGRSADCPCW